MRAISFFVKTTRPDTTRTFAGFPYFLIALLASSIAFGQNQSAELNGVTLETAQALEAVNPDDGSSAFVNSAPSTFIYEGVVLNTPSQMSDQTPNDNDGGNPIPFAPDPYWQIFVQSTQPGDSGGVAVYMAQNYGNITGTFTGSPPNVVFQPDTGNDYSNSQWYDNTSITPWTDIGSQVNRLNYYNNDQNTVNGATLTTGRQIQAGDEVIIFARGGLDYGGKYNINEEHTATGDYSNPSNTGFSFDIFYAGSHGMPTPIDVNLDDYSLSNLNGLWNSSSNSVLFDSTRETGAEEFQGDWVNLLDVKLVNPDDSGWMANGTVLVENPAGHEFMLQLGNFTPGTAPTGYFNATGIFDQEGNSNLASAEGNSSPGMNGYEVWVMDPSDIMPTPEPSTLVLAIVAMVGLLGWQLRLRRAGAA